MTLGAALGANLWMVAVLLPILFGHSFSEMAAMSHARGVVSLAAVMLLGPLVLAFGALRRSSLVLVVAFPVAVMLPQAFGASSSGRPLVPPAPFVLVALLLLGYLGAMAWTLERGARPRPVTPTKKLEDEPLPARWRRRLRMYRWFTLLAAILPAALLFFVEVWPGVTALDEPYAGHVEAAQALVTAGVGLLWILLFRSYLVAPLYGHLQHDREVVRAIEQAKRQAKRGRPRQGFYVAVAIALVAIALVVWQRTR
jgi:hypothetical protein